MSKILDYTELSHFLSKLKTTFALKSDIPTKTSQLTNDSGYKTTTYIHPAHIPHVSGLYKITVDNEGHVTDVKQVTKEDILSLDILSENSFEIDDGNLFFNY